KFLFEARCVSYFGPGIKFLCGVAYTSFNIEIAEGIFFNVSCRKVEPFFFNHSQILECGRALYYFSTQARTFRTWVHTILGSDLMASDEFVRSTILSSDVCR
ncbi:unnamed protein product, partial [Laminaria digitata]